MLFLGCVAGIWRPRRGRQRAGTYGAKGKQNGFKLLVAYETSTQYHTRFDFYGIGERKVPKIVPVEMGKAIVRALQSKK